MRKLYYTPGIISLIGFFFILPYSFKRIIPKKERTIKLYAAKERSDNEFDYSEDSISKYISKRERLNFILDANLNTNERKLEIIRYEARKLKYTFDTSSVILINFTPELPYRQFIKLIDQCKQDSIRRYSMVGNGFVIFGELPPKKPEPNTISYFSCDYIPYHPPSHEKSFRQKLITTIMPYANLQTLGLLIGWIILAVMSLHLMKRRVLLSQTSSTP